MNCSVTLDDATIQLDADDPDQTVTCTFLDMTNSLEDYALVTLGQRIATSPRLYAAGTQILVVASRTSGNGNELEVERKIVTLGSGGLTVHLNIISTAALGMNNNNALDNNSDNPDDPDAGTGETGTRRGGEILLGAPEGSPL